MEFRGFPTLSDPQGLAVSLSACCLSRTSVSMVMLESSSDAWSLGTGKERRQGKHQIQDETPA